MQITRVKDLDEGIEAAFDLFKQQVVSANRPVIALSGGSTPEPLYSAFQSYYSGKPQHVSPGFCWVDERIVSYDSPRSNYGSCVQRFPAVKNFTRVPFPTELPVEEIPDVYRRSLKAYGLCNTDGLLTPTVSIVGMGADGHTASVFPGVPLVHGNDVAAMCVQPNTNEWRATLTLQTILGSEMIIALVFGKDKQVSLRKCLTTPSALPFGQLVSKRLFLITDIDV